MGKRKGKIKRDGDWFKEMRRREERKDIMEWRDEGVIIGKSRNGEKREIVEVMKWGNGRNMGMVRGGR